MSYGADRYWLGKHLDTSLVVEEALWGALLGLDKLAVNGVNVGGQQGSGMSISTGNQNSWGAADISSQTGSHQGSDVVGDGDQNLATQMATLLLRGELVLKVDTCSTKSHLRTGLSHHPASWRMCLLHPKMQILAPEGLLPRSSRAPCLYTFFDNL